MTHIHIDIQAFVGNRNSGCKGQGVVLSPPPALYSLIMAIHDIFSTSHQQDYGCRCRHKPHYINLVHYCFLFLPACHHSYPQAWHSFSTCCGGFSSVKVRPFFRSRPLYSLSWPLPEPVRFLPALLLEPVHHRLLYFSSFSSSLLRFRHLCFRCSPFLCGCDQSGSRFPVPTSRPKPASFHYPLLPTYQVPLLCDSY